MGGMCAKEFLDWYKRDAAPFGKVVLVLDTSPSAVADIKVPRPIVGVASWYRGGPLSSALWAIASQAQDKPSSDDTADTQTVANAHHAGAWAGMPAITSQTAYIADFPPLAVDELASVAERVVYLRSSPSDDDRLVRVTNAIAGWRRAAPHLRVVTLTGRPARWHLPIIEYPQETVLEILKA